MKIIHVFRSGNDCIVILPDRMAKGELSEFNVKWEVWPPSAEDGQEWSQTVFPLKVIPSCELLAQKEHGAALKAGMVQ